MKAFYLRAIGRTSVILLICSFFQVARGSDRPARLNRLNLSNNNIIVTDTPKTARKVNAIAPKDDDDKNNPEDGKDDDIKAREKQEFLRTRDPKLNVVPIERLIAARSMQRQLILRKNAIKNSGVTNGTIIGGNTSPINNIQWTERGPNNVGGRTRALMFDLNDAANGYKKVFAGGVDGGLWYTNDITATPVEWNKIDDFFDNIAISCIAQNPVNPKEIYAGTGEGWYNADGVRGLGLWKTSDDGATWTMLASTAGFNYVNSVLVDRNGNVYIAAFGFGVEKSSDGGVSWNQVISQPADGGDLQMAANGDLYASTGVFSTGNIFMSDFSINGAATGDAGTWTNITPDVTGVMDPNTQDWYRIKLACAPSNAGIVYAFMEGTTLTGADGDNISSIQQYTKSTNTWAVKNLPAVNAAFGNDQGWYSIAAAVDPHDANTLYAGSLDAVRSTDGGITWFPVTQWRLDEYDIFTFLGVAYELGNAQYVHADHHAYVFAPGSSSRLLMGTDGGIFYSTNANATSSVHPAFASKDHSYNVTQFYSVALHPTDKNYLIGGTQDNGTQQFTLPGSNATNEVTGGDGGFAFIDQLNPNIQISSYVYGTYYVSTDNGHSFSLAINNGGSAFINPTDYDSKQKILYAGDGLGGDYMRWTQVPVASSTTIPTVSNVSDVSVPGLNYGNITSVTISPITANRIYFGLDNGTVVVVDNANSGNNKSSITLNPNQGVYASVSCVAIDPNSEDHLLVSYFNYGVVSIYETKNASAASPTWTQVEGNLPDMPVRWVMFYPGDVSKAIIATELGVWTTDKLIGPSTAWEPSNSGLANVEVDMLRFRPSDRTIAAATHGRGMFTAILSSSDATLAGLKLSDGTLSPVFASATASYTASVGNGTASVTVTPTTNDPTATVSVNGMAVTSGTASGAIPLKVGQNNIAVTVDASDGVTTETYTVTVTRAPSNNAALSNITASTGTLAPVFANATTDYAIAVPNATENINIKPTAADPTATIMINGTPATSGGDFGPVSLNVGANTINILITAQDGHTNKTYTVTVTRDKGQQTITLNAFNEVSYGTPDFSPGATVNSGLPITYTSSESSVATIINGLTHITGVGLSTITASADANSQYYAAAPALQTLKVDKSNQTINFTAIPTLIKGSQFDLSQINASSGLPVTFIPDDPQIASVQGQTLNANYIGTTILTANQAGNANYYPAESMFQNITVRDAAGNDILVHQAVSPNGDGVNDFLYIEGIGNYPENTVTLVNPEGVVVYRAFNYNNMVNVFDGHSNITGTLLYAGTYYYNVEFTVNGIQNHKMGFIVLKYK